MGILVLVLLVAAWGLVLGPALLRNSQEPSPLKTEKMFSRALKALGGSRNPKGVVGGRWVLVPKTADYPSDPTEGDDMTRRRARRSSAAERRRKNLRALAIFIISTFFLGLIPPLRFLLYLTIAACVLLVAYLGAALYFASRPVELSDEGRTRVDRLEGHASATEAAGGGW